MPTKEWLKTIEDAATKMAEGPSKDERSSAYWTHWGKFMREYVELVTPTVVLELVEMARTAASVFIERKDLKSDKKFLQTEYTVRATDDDRTRMWADWAIEAKGVGRSWDHRVPWEQDTMGLAPTVGELGTFPIVIHFSWATVNKSLVAFWAPVSQVVDYSLCEKWIEQHFTKAREHTDKIERVISDQNYRREKHKR